MSVASIKAAVRQRSGYRCDECGMTQDQHRQRFGRGLEVHRVVPGSTYSVSGCVCLCRPCHARKPRRPYGTGTDFYIRLPESFRDCLRELQDKMEEEHGYQPRMTDLVAKGLRDLFAKHGIKPPPRH